MISEEKKNNQGKQLKAKSVKKGVVVSDKMDKTVVVKVNTLKKHSRYQKRYISSKKYKVHDEKNIYSIGDEVIFTACRPISKNKQWIVVAEKNDKK